MENTKNEGKNQLEWIASIRGIAALLVFLSHLPIDLPYDIKFIIGRIGVVVFFMITGYLTIQSRGSKNTKQYLFNRFMRMYPVYWILLILTWLLNYNEDGSIVNLIANATLFQEFLGFECIIGASWMMPIQVCYFILIAIIGVNIFIRKSGKENNKLKMIIILFSIFSIFSGIIRRYMEIPFPTAFFLLMFIAFLGIAYNYYIERNISKKEIWSYWIIFEISMIISTLLSYKDMFVAYIIAYNLGIALFVLAKQIKLNLQLAKKLGEIGFTFFLGADVPYKLLSNFIDFQSSTVMLITGCILKFVFAICLAVLITKYIEKPLLKASKKIERKLI